MLFRAYPAYVNFFADIVRRQGISSAVEEYLFGKEANEKGVSMLLRFMGGLYVYLIIVSSQSIHARLECIRLFTWG